MRLAIGDYTSMSEALLEKATLTPNPETTHALIANSDLMDCDLTLMEWRWFRYCRIEGGRLPAKGNIRDARGCLVLHDDLGAKHVAIA